MKTGDCKKVQKIWLNDEFRHAETSAELLDAHLKSCPSCRVEFEIYELAKLDDSCRPAPQLDELRRRRWLETAVEKAAYGGFARSRQSAGSPFSTTDPAKRRLIVGVLAAGILFAALLSFLLRATNKEPNLPADELSPQIAAIETNGQLLLFAGKVEADGSPVGANHEIHSGQRFEVASGHAILSLTQDISLVVTRETALSFTCINEQCVGVTLHRGHILAEVRPEREGAPFFIDTPAGRVVVTGTALGVTVTEESAIVEVYRGSVVLEEKNGTTRRLGFGERAELGQETVHHVDDAKMQSASGQMKIIELLDGKTDSTLNVESSPSGALVSLDDVTVGRTPLHAAIRPGHRTLALELDGFDSIRELIDLSPGTHRSRAFLLSRSEMAMESKPSAQLDATLRSPEALLEAAQKHRRAGRWHKAEAAYKTLIRSYPKRAEARSSLVSLGFVQLEHLRRPQRALKSYNLYLKRAPGGPLAQEAAFGRSLALRALGRKGAEIKALRHFVEQYPSASQSSRARKRLSMLE